VKIRLVLVVILTIMGIVAPSFAQSPSINGTHCMVLGKTTTIIRVKFTCLKIGQVNVWATPDYLAKETFRSLAKSALDNPENYLPIPESNSRVLVTKADPTEIEAFLPADSRNQFTTFGPTPLIDTKINREHSLSLLTGDGRMVYHTPAALPPWSVGFKIRTTDQFGRFIIKSSSYGNAANSYAWRLAYRPSNGKWRYQNTSGRSGKAGNISNFDQVTLGSPGEFSIRLEFESLTTFYGLGLFQGTQIFPLLEKDAKRVLVIGDSFVLPVITDSEQFHVWDAFPGALAWLTGWNVISSGIGGQGYINAPSYLAETYRDRIVVDILPQKPDVVIFTGSPNDVCKTCFGSSELNKAQISKLASEMAYDVALLKKIAPNILVIICSPFQATPEQNLAMLNQAKNINVPYIDFFTYPLLDKVNNAQNKLVNGHPTRLGSTYIAEQILIRLTSLASYFP